jgi:hypothetical protein
MRFALKSLPIIVAVLLLAGLASAASFTASLDRDALTLGESATLSLTFEGGQARNLPKPSVSGLRFDQNGSSQNFSIVNGAMSSTVAVNYSVTPLREGEFTIPALTATVNGESLSTTPLKLIVTKASAPTAEAVNSGNEVAFLKLVFPKPSVYVGESGVARLELYLRDDVQNFGDFQITSSPTDGFNAGKLMERPNQRRRAQVGNRSYTVIPMEFPLTAVRTGPLTLGPIAASVVVILPSRDRGGDPFFRQFFNQGEQKQMTLATDPVSVESLPLPEAGKPANFTGAVGQFDLAASAGPTTVTVGDPVTIRAQISGRGALEALTLPALESWQNFKTYPPTTKLETTDRYGFQGTKTFELIVSPLNTDVHELPPLTFSFFNPEDGQYHTLTNAAVPLTVKAASATPLPTIAVNKPAAPESQTPQEILPPKGKLGTLSQTKTPLVAQPVFLAAQSLPVLAFLAALIWRKREDNLANNPRLRRRRAVAQIVAGGLVELKEHAAANEPDKFFATLFRLLQEQLGERLDCPASAITENVVDEHTLLRGAPDALRNALREQFQLCNQARYAPVRGASELNTVAKQFEQLIDELQDLKA